jgi:hypothetical protein
MMPTMKKKMDGAAIDMGKSDAVMAAAQKFIAAVKDGDANKLVEAFCELDILTSTEGEEEMDHGQLEY